MPRQEIADIAAGRLSTEQLADNFSDVAPPLDRQRALIAAQRCYYCYDAPCIQACPTGIDIRNGTQLECTNCTACIDECDTIMKSIGYPKGLIRYASEDEIERKEPFRFTARMKGYTSVLIILIGILTGLLFLRNEVETDILRLPGQLYQHKGDVISNVYTYKIVNKTVHDLDDIHFMLLSQKGIITRVGNAHFKVPKQGISQGTLFIEIKDYHLNSEKTKLEIGVFQGKHLIETTKTNFLSPRSFN